MSLSVQNDGGFLSSARNAGRCLQFLVCAGFLTVLTIAFAETPCGNPIACENALTGNLPSEWDIVGSGDPSIQGFASDISINRGQTVSFKVNTAATYQIDIYRLGYYAGRGARKVASVAPIARTQPQCVRDVSSGLFDCGNWAVSATWAVPSTATSGVYIARLVRLDTGGASHVIFVVRDDTGNSNLLFQTSDTTWQAYNNYGGASLYWGNGPGPAGGRAYKVSYNRPFSNRSIVNGDSTPLGFFFTDEYPMVRWLEANGYNVSYAAGVDTDRRGVTALKTHKVFLSVGHDEYWSSLQRSNVEAARDAGVNLAFFSGNEMFWKTRWENSIAGTSTTYRTLVCYKETHANARIDPSGVWTGTWRDPRFSPPADGGKPENALTGQLFSVNGDRSDPMSVPSEAGKMRFWRNTGLAAIANGQSVQFPTGILGYEWDEPADNGFRPPGLMQLSSTTIRVDGYYLQDYGSTYGPGTATHGLTLYRHSSGALVFGAGTTQWAWGLDGIHDYPGTQPDVRLKQATVNLLADMGVQPASLQSDMVAATASTDVIAPVSLISVTPNLSVPAWTPLTIFGTASDLGGGRPAAVEFSADGGNTWHAAQGTSNWSASWITGSPGTITVKSRAIDDSGRIESAGPGVPIKLTANSASNTLWPPETVPTVLANPDASAVELGVRFKPQVNGSIKALRFYKSATNTGTHIGNLWTSNGTNLATISFANETEFGWQQAQLNSPIPVTAGTYYVASYHTNVGNYSHDVGYFSGQSLNSPPLFAPADGTVGANGLYHYGASGFPTDSAQASNYWVDIVFSADLSPDLTPPSIVSVSPPIGFSNAGTLDSITAKFSEAMTPASISNLSFLLKDAQNNAVLVSTSYDAATRTASIKPSAALKGNTAYTAIIKAGATGVVDMSGNKLPADFTWTFTTGPAPAGGYTLWPPQAVPTMMDNPDSAEVELGVRFSSDRDGWITALRFYKSLANTGAHTASLWTNTGLLLGTVAFSGETASGWQQMQLPAAVPITAGTYYVASYHTQVGHYSDDVNYFLGQGLDSQPLFAAADGEGGGNGLYHYGATAFPTETSQASNYWVDVAFAPATLTPAPIFSPSPGTYSTGISVTLSDAAPGAKIFFTLDGTIPTASSTLYTTAIGVTANTTIKAIAAVPGWANSSVSTANFTIVPITQTALPSFDPVGGTYSSAISVSLSDATPGAQIYYTVNGSTPTVTSVRYLAPIAVATNTSVKAIAVATGLSNSPIATADYGFQAAPPVISPMAGIYSSPQSVVLSDVSPGATIYYTTNGTAPTTASTRYTAPIPVSSTTTINAIAAVNGWSNSSVSSAIYTIQLPTRPAAPSSLAAVAAGATQIVLTWADLATDETGFKIERKTGATGAYAQIATVAANVASYTDATVGASTTYFYRVRSTNGGGDSSYSNETSATTPALGAPPPPWTQSDIGSPGVAGAGTYSSGSFTVKGSGADIWNAADAFYFVYQPLNGNGEIVARVASVQNTDPWAKAGVMIRETTGSGARNAFMAVTPGNGLAFQRRLTTGGASTSTSGVVVTAPYWVRLVRSGNTLTGYASTNGSSWTQVGSDTITMGTAVQIGLAVTAHNNAVSCTAVIDNVTVVTPIGVPSSLTAVAVSGSQVNLSWTDNATNETAFKIERKTGASGTYAQIATTGANVASYSDTGLASSTNYYYRVRATNASGDSGYSNEASVTTLTPPPATPTGVTASTISSSQISLSWTDVVNETGFKIERKTGASGTYVQISTTGTNIVSYNDTGLTVNTTYFYRIRATNTGGDSAYSAEVSATTLNTAPAAPSGLTATAVSTTQVSLSWADNSPNETGFRIERSIGTNFVEITTVGAGVTAFGDTGLVPGTNYLYRVRATNLLGDSAYSNQATATTLVLPPSTPVGLTATATSGSQINLSWSDVATETGFKIERKTGAGGTYAQIATVGASVTTYSNTGLSGNTTYFYRIRATNPGGDSAYSAEANATTLNSAPAAPATLTAVAASGTQINLSWSDVANEAGFKIERKTGAGGTYAQIATTNAGVLTYSNTGLTAGITYFYRVRSTNSAGDSSYSPEASATTTSVPIFRSASSAGVTSGGLTLSIGKPTGTVQGDVMIASIAVRPSSATVTASGWTLIRRLNNASGNANSLAVYYKVAGASEPSSYAFTFNTSTGAAGGIRTFSGVDTTSPVDVEAGQNTASGLAHASPSVTTRFTNDLIVTSHAFATSATFTPPAGMTEAFDVRSDAIGSGGVSMEGNYQLQPAAGATGVRTATGSNDADTGNAHTLALKAR